MTGLDLAEARDRAATLRTYELVYRREAVAATAKEEAKLKHEAAEVAAELADEAEDDAEALAMFLEAMREAAE